MDVVGGATEGTPWRCICGICGGSAGFDKTLWTAAADHPPSDSKCHQRRGGPHPAAEVGEEAVKAFRLSSIGLNSWKLVAICRT